MKVFISWSKEPSRTIAVELAAWLKTIVQVTVPWMSDRDIRSGRRWREVIGSALQDTNVGIICLTRTNQHEPWLVFEAGALAKLDHAQVIPLYIDLEPAEVVGPLEDWQGRSFDRDGMWQVVYDINAATTQPVSEESLRRLFDLTWPELDAAVEAAKAKHRDAPTPEKREQQSMLEELVERVRRIERNAVFPGQVGVPTVSVGGDVGPEVTLLGTIRNVELMPQGADADVSLKAELFDGTEEVTLIWMGRRGIPGMEPGRTVRVRGRLAIREGRKVLYNPYYEMSQRT